MKYLFSALLLLVTQKASAELYDYSFLAFQTSDGSIKTISVSSLSLTIDNGVLIAASSDKTEYFPLSELFKMYFTTKEDMTKVQPLTTADSCEFVVTSLAGVPYGSYSSVEAARRSLPVGTYIIKNSKESIKIVVR